MYLFCALVTIHTVFACARGKRKISTVQLFRVHKINKISTKAQIRYIQNDVYLNLRARSTVAILAASVARVISRDNSQFAVAPQGFKVLLIYFEIKNYIFAVFLGFKVKNRHISVHVSAYGHTIITNVIKFRTTVHGAPSDD